MLIGTSVFTASTAIFVSCVVVMVTEADTSSPEILFTGRNYLKYTPSKSVYETFNNNKLEFFFRTVHPSGLLVLLTGKQKLRRNAGHKDVLTVQLIQGYLSYSVSTFGKRQSQILIAGNFNDNQWHHVAILRTNSLNEIQIDHHTKTLISPPLYKNLSYQDHVYVGGYDHSNNAHRLTTKTAQDTTTMGDIPIMPRFNGCMRLVEVDNRDPIKYFHQGSKRIEVKPKGQFIITGVCSDTQYRPVSFTKAASSLTFNLHQVNTTTTAASTTTLRSANRFTVKFSIRTFSASDLVFETDEPNEGMKMSLQDKKMSLKLWRLRDQWETNLATDVVVADGLWHDVKVVLSGTEVEIIVDMAPKVNLRLSHSVDLNSNRARVRFGDNGKNKYASQSFVGCLNNFVIQDIKFQDVLTDDNVVKENIKEGCVLLDHCFPDPCLNGGKCQQDWKERRCDCTGTEFYGKFCEQSLYKSSCAAYQAFGLNESSFCLLDSDGSGPLLPHTTFCQLSPKTKEVSTIVHHNKQFKFKSTEGDETFHSYIFHRFNYELDLKNIRHLLQNSIHCRQKVVFECYNTALFNTPDGPPNVVWKTGAGLTKTYWGGVASNGTGCECGLTKSCSNPDKLCNCDEMSNRKSADSGYITDKADLPVLRLDVTGMSEGLSTFYVGPLECFGVKDQEKQHDTGKELFTKDLLSKVCISVSSKEKQIRIANHSVRAKIHREEPLPKTTEPAPISYFPVTRPGHFVDNTGDPVVRMTYNTDDDDDDDEEEEDGLSVIEIVLIAIAVVATFTLIIKFVFCNIFNRLHGKVLLNHDRRFDEPNAQVTQETLAVTSSLKRNQNTTNPTINCTKNCVKTPNNYWV